MSVHEQPHDPLRATAPMASAGKKTMWQHYWPVYERLEKEVRDASYSVAITDSQLAVHSLRFADLLLRICSECENAAKTLAAEWGLAAPPGCILEQLRFSEIGNILCSRVPFFNAVVEIVWPFQDLSITQLQPFSTWSAQESKNPAWYQGYNGLKHDRNTNRAEANGGNVIHALAALFVLNLWLRKEEIEQQAEWITLQRQRISSFSSFFSPRHFLVFGKGGTTVRLSLKIVD